MATIAFKRTLASTDWRPVFRASEILGRQRSTPCSLGREIPGRITQNLVRMAGRRNDVEIGPVPRLFPSAESKNTGRTKVSPYTRRRARARVCVCVCVCLHGIPHSFGDHENGEGLGVFGVREEWRLRPPVAVAERRSAGQRESSERWWQRPQPQQPQRQQQQQHRHRAPAATTSRPTERRGRSLRFGGGLFVEWLAAEAGLRWGRKGPAPAPAPAPARPLRALLTASSFSREMCRGADVSLPSLVSRL